MMARKKYNEEEEIEGRDFEIDPVAEIQKAKPVEIAIHVVNPKTGAVGGHVGKADPEQFSWDYLKACLPPGQYWIQGRGGEGYEDYEISIQRQIELADILMLGQRTNKEEKQSPYLSPNNPPTNNPYNIPPYPPVYPNYYQQFSSKYDDKFANMLESILTKVLERKETKEPDFTGLLEKVGGAFAKGLETATKSSMSSPKEMMEFMMGVMQLRDMMAESGPAEDWKMELLRMIRPVLNSAELRKSLLTSRMKDGAKAPDATSEPEPQRETELEKADNPPKTVTFEQWVGHYIDSLISFDLERMNPATRAATFLEDLPDPFAEHMTQVCLSPMSDDDLLKKIFELFPQVVENKVRREWFKIFFIEVRAIIKDEATSDD